MPTMTQRVRSGWNAFIGRDPTINRELSFGNTQEVVSYGYGMRPDRHSYASNSKKSIVGSIYNRISVDVASVNIEHAKLDKDRRYLEPMDSSLNERIKVSANKDQTGRAFVQDMVESLFDEGVIAVVPTHTDHDPESSERIKIDSMRTGKIIGWYPDIVKVHVYNEDTGRYQDILMRKEEVAIIENPFYSIMNEPNSTLQRLIQAINKLNAVNDISSSSKLDLIIQLPYVTKSPQRKAEAQRRRKEIEDQLSTSRLGIAYTDGTERVTQLNRSLDNNLWTQVKELTTQLYSELGITPSILDGTADEATRINYFNDTIAPILDAIVDEFNRKFLTKTARTQGQAFVYFRDPFKLVPVSELAKFADTFTRNEIMTTNEVRGAMGMKPSKDPKADMLMNSNLNMTDEQAKAVYGAGAGNADSNPSKVDGLLQKLGNQSTEGGESDA